MDLIKKYWLTPPELYKKLDNEFNFDFDPCPCPILYRKERLRAWIN